MSWFSESELDCVICHPEKDKGEGGFICRDCLLSVRMGEIGKEYGIPSHYVDWSHMPVYTSNTSGTESNYEDIVAEVVKMRRERGWKDK